MCGGAGHRMRVPLCGRSDSVTLGCERVWGTRATNDRWTRSLHPMVRQNVITVQHLQMVGEETLDIWNRS